MQFLQELNESRLIRTLKHLRSRSSEDLAERLFEHLLALQIIAQQDPNWAKAYADQTMKYQNFEGFRTSQNDLYNLITLVMNPDRYAYAIKDTQSYALPELRLKRNLRNIENSNFLNRDFSEMMIILQRQFDNLKGQHFSLRRIISDWANQPTGEKRIIIRRMLINMRERGIQSDLYVKLERELAKLNKQ